MKSKAIPFLFATLVLANSARAAILTWDITESTNQTIEDGAGTWESAPGSPLLTWNDETIDNANIDWSNTLHNADTAIFGAGGTGAAVTVNGTIQLAALTFNAVTGSYTLANGTSGALTAPGGTLTLTNNDTGADRRSASGATIGALLTGSANLVFAGAGDNIALTNTANDFIGEIRISGGGISIGSDSVLGNAANDIAITGAGGYLRTTTALTLNRDIAFSAGTSLALVNGLSTDATRVLTLPGNISGGDSASTLTIGGGHGPGNGNHRVILTGSNTFSGTLRIYGQLRAYEGAGLSANANISLGDALPGSTNAPNTSGILETSGDFVRPLGSGAGQFSWTNEGTYHSGGFSAVAAPLTVSLGGLATPTAVTWAAGTNVGFLRNLAELRFQNNNATHPVTFANAINLNNAARTVFVGASSFPATLSGVLSGTGSSGLTKTGTGILALSNTNTYAGITTITTGVLEAATLADGGSDSSIGASPNAAANLVFGAATATLRHTGSVDADIDRGFTLSSGTGGGATIESSGTGTLSFDNTVAIAYGTIDQTRTLTLGGTNTGANTFSKVIADNGTGLTSLTKSGIGTWTLSGTNTHTGTTTVSGGTLVLGHASNTLADTAAVTITAGGTLSLGANSDTVGTVTLTNGSISGSTGILTGSSYALANGSISAILAGTGTITKTTAATVILSGANTYSGVTTLSGGTLRITHGSALGTTAGNTAIGNTSTLEVAGGISTSERLAPTAAGSAAAADRIVNVSGNNTLGGNIGNITGGNHYGIRSDAGNLTINGNITFPTTSTRTLYLRGDGDGVVNGTITYSGTATVPVVKEGNGTWTLTGANNYNGATTVTAGTLHLAAGSSASPITVNSGAYLGFTLGSTITSTSTITLDAGAKIKISGTTGAPSYTLINAASPIAGTPVLDVAIPGYTLVVDGNSIKLNSTASFSSWITGTFANGNTVPSGQQGANDDPDNDGISNLVEYAVDGQDPTVSNTTIGSFTNNVLSFTKRGATSGLTYAIEESTDLGISDDWTVVSGGSYVNNATTISYTLTPSTPAKNFARLKVQN